MFLFSHSSSSFFDLINAILPFKLTAHLQSHLPGRKVLMLGVTWASETHGIQASLALSFLSCQHQPASIITVIVGQSHIINQGWQKLNDFWSSCKKTCRCLYHLAKTTKMCRKEAHLFHLECYLLMQSTVIDQTTWFTISKPVTVNY